MTTDTRTVMTEALASFVADPTPEKEEAYTARLEGYLALQDAEGRQALWLQLNQELRSKLRSELPEDRQGLTFDEYGYADIDEVGFRKSLWNIHNGHGEDFLAVNNLTELHGWATEDNYGRVEKPIVTPNDEHPEGVTKWEVRSVELHNTRRGREGETRTVYLLHMGDGLYNTYGSYGEALADLKTWWLNALLA